MVCDFDENSEISNIMAPKLKLTYKKTRLLICEVEKRRCLWDGTHDYYNDPYHVGIAWREISQKLNIPAHELKVKWKNIRSNFSRRQKKLNENGDYYSKSPYNECLQFLMSKENNEDSNEGTNSSDNDFNSETKSDIILKDEFDDNHDEENKEYDVPLKKLKVNEFNDYYENNMHSESDNASNSSISMSDNETVDDEHDLMFLKSLTPYFCQLDSMRKFVLRSRIQDLLLNAVTAKHNSKENN